MPCVDLSFGGRPTPDVTCITTPMEKVGHVRDSHHAVWERQADGDETTGSVAVQSERAFLLSFNGLALLILLLSLAAP